MERLIPEWFLDKIKILSVGGHASPGKLNLGKGQSPLSWIIMSGYKSFNFYMFKINKNIDDGEIISVKKINFERSHKISDIYKKIILNYCHMIENIFKKTKIIFKNRKERKIFS